MYGKAENRKKVGIIKKIVFMKMKLYFFIVLLSVSIISCNNSQNSEKQTEVKNQLTQVITYDEVNAAQQAWCDAVVQIAKLHAESDDYKTFAEQVLTDAYDYDNGMVFFKPTLTTGNQTFRMTKKGALSYFVGGDTEYPNDKGFGIKPWVKASYDNYGEGNDGIQLQGNIAITMGNVSFTDKDGDVVTVDKTWAFKKGDDGKIRIILHHSSLPYSEAK